jgi:hypothetical protein
MNIRDEISHLSEPITSFTTHPKNVRQGDIGAISESLKAHGQYRAIVVQRSTGHILAGNHTYLAAKHLGWENIAATFVDCTDEQAIKILLVDNRTTDLASYDNAGLIELLKELSVSPTGLVGTAFDGDDLDTLITDLQMELDEANPYTQAIKVPTYEIVGEQPTFDELCNQTKYKTMVNEIEQSDVSDNLKQFLKLAATRHLVFDYAKIAEFYAHLDTSEQDLFEQSALVIIDFDQAIELGYASFQTNVNLLSADDDE